MKYYFELMRIRHWIKNILIFLPLFFSQSLGNAKELYINVISFLAFSLMCSAVYIMNDIYDAERDKNHPEKRRRPIAAGYVSITAAIFMTIMLLGGSFVLLIFFKINIGAFFCLGIYFFVNIVYSCLGGKNIAILDIALLACGYPLRVVLGGVVSGIEVSGWLYLTVFCIAFWLALGKRLGEFKTLGGSEAKTRVVLMHYTESFLEKHMYMSMFLAIVFYSLWAVEKNGMLVWTVPLVFLICMKYNLLISGGAHGDPIDTFFSSKALITMVGVYIIILGIIIYFPWHY